MRETVVLVHGIWMTGLELRPLARRMRAAGYDVHIFHYPSLRAGPAANAARLNGFLEKLETDVVHLMAHSLGGLVLCHLFHDFPVQRPGLVVMLGSPLRGSAVARHFHRWLLTRWLLGRSIDHGLLGDGPNWPAGRPLAMVAGNRGWLGIGSLTGAGLPKPNDGTVAVVETDVDAVTDQLLVPYGHFGMLFAPAVAEAVIGYLRHGRFKG